MSDRQGNNVDIVIVAIYISLNLKIEDITIFIYQLLL